MGRGAGAERATLGLARVGSRAALNFAFAFLRRAWRSGEDADLCTELLQVILRFDPARICTLLRFRLSSLKFSDWYSVLCFYCKFHSFGSFYTRIF